MAGHSKARNGGLEAVRRSLNHTSSIDLSSDTNSADDIFEYRAARQRRKHLASTDLSNDFDSPNIDESMTDTSDFIQYAPVQHSGLMGPPPPPLQRPSAPSPDPFEELSHTSSWDDSSAILKRQSAPLQRSLLKDWHSNSSGESLKIGSPNLSTYEDRDRIDESSKYDKDKNLAIKYIPSQPNDDTADTSPLLTAFPQRETSPRLSVFELNHHNPNYTDLEEPHLPDHLEGRLEAMRAANAEEHFHNRIPAEDAPPHMQMMVLLYQWAAWALDMSDQKKRERMIKWVNGRTLDFMMSGGRIPGYDLKQLLEIAGVDPKEIYGWGSESSQQDKSMAYLNSAQLAARSGIEEDIGTQHETESAGKLKLKRNIDHDNSLGNTTEGDFMPAAAESAEPSLIQIDEDESDKDSGVRKNNTQESVTINCENAVRNRNKPFSTIASDMVYDGQAQLEGNGNRAVVSADDDHEQKRQRMDASTAIDDHSTIIEISSPNQDDTPRMRSPAAKLLDDLELREEYRKTFFKAQLNAVLKSHNKPQIRKDISEWSQLERRLLNAGLSIKIIGMLRDDFNNGSKTWDHSVFSTLPPALQSNSSKKAEVKAKVASSTQLPTPPRSVGVARSIYKPNDKPPANKRKRSKVQEDHYDSADGEWTAAKTSVTTRGQAATIPSLSSTSTSIRGPGKGSGSKRGRKPKSSF